MSQGGFENVFYFDCQTTGASPAFGHLLELGWADGDNPPESQVLRLPEGSEIPRRVIAMTGITSGELLLGQAVDEVVPLLIDRVAKPWLIHFARFEKQWFSELGLSSSEPDIFCTYEIARRLYPGLTSRSLRAVAGHLGLALPTLKRSAHHVAATQFVWQAMRKDLAAEGINSWPDLRSWLVDTRPVKTSKKTYCLPAKVRLALPEKPGVYLFKAKDGSVLYVGKATSLKSRVNSYFRGQKTKGSRINELRAQIHGLETIVTGSPLESALQESDLIKRHDPPYNKALKRGQRQLVFCDNQLRLGSDFVWGPFTVTTALATLNTLLDDGYPAEQNAISAGLWDEGMVMAQDWLNRPIVRDETALRRLFSSAWQRSVKRAHRKLWDKMQIDVEQEEEVEDSQAETEEEWEWTPQLVSRLISSHVFSIARQGFRVRWLHRLSNCRLQWQDESDQEYRLRVDQTAIGNTSRTGAIGSDLLAYDRINTLYTEILRLLKKDLPVTIDFDDGEHTLDQTVLRRLMYPQYFLPSDARLCP